MVFVHAHPDDEAIFTGGTMARLSEAGCRVVLVMATRGELGEPPTASPAALGAIREAETAAAAEVLGTEAVHHLGYHDSGLASPSAAAPKALASAPLDEVAAALADVLRAERASAVIGYDEGGIYGHVDHVAVAQATARAACLAGVATRYDATVDREYLHFVETHLVVEAYHAGLPAQALRQPLSRSVIGLPSVLITTTVDVRPVLDRKRAAMAAHASQIPPGSSSLRLAPAAFAEVYGFEWYARHGPPGPLEGLAAG